MDKQIAKLNKDSNPRIWAALTVSQQRVVIGINSFTAEDHFDVDALGKRIGRTRKAVERTINQIVAAGLFSKLHHGRAGGGRAPNELILADLGNPAIAGEIAARLVKANGQAILAEKGNGQALLSQKANGQLPPPSTLVHLPPALVHLVPPSSNVLSQGALGLPGQNNLRGEPNGSIVDTNPLLVKGQNGKAGDHTGPFAPPAHPLPPPNSYLLDPAFIHEQDLIQYQLDLNSQPGDAECEWMESHLDIEVEPEPFRLLAIDPGSIAVGWALLGPGPIYITSGCEPVRGVNDISARAQHAGQIAAHLIATNEPGLIVLESPDFTADGLKAKSMETFMQSYREIEHVVKASGIPFCLWPASLLTRHLPINRKHEIKDVNAWFFKAFVGRAGVEHECDATRIGYEYLRSMI